MSDIRIDYPGAGKWLMDQVGSRFYDEHDHSIVNFRDDKPFGGFVLNHYLGASIAVHMAGIGPGWCTRDLMWMMFHYAFRQLGCHKMIAPVASDNHKALDMDLRAGWQLESVVRDAYAPGRHLMILTMGVADCRWLRLIPKQYLPGDVVERVQG